MTTWKRVKWSEAAQILEVLAVPPADRGPGATPEAYFAGLRQEGKRLEAADFLAQALPRLEAVAWAAQTVRDIAPPAPTSSPQARALRAALFWLQDQSDTRRRAAYEAAQACEPSGPESMAALAVFLSGGSLAPAQYEPVQPPKHAAGLCAAGAVKMAALRTEATLDELWAALDRALDAGEAIARTGLPVPA